MSRTKSPYLSSGTRLADVIAALTATATYKFYQLPFDGDRGWAYRIAADPSKASDVKALFREHPEFFRIDREKNGSLVWRRQHQKLFDVDRGEEISRTDYEAFTKEQKGRVSRVPLEPTQLATLINAAIELHERAVAQEQSRRWWVTPLVTLGSAFGGAYVGAGL